MSCIIVHVLIILSDYERIHNRIVIKVQAYPPLILYCPGRTFNTTSDQFEINP